MLDGKKLLITGGTGSFGNAVLRRFLKTPIEEIRIFSRDEKKQDDQRKKFNNLKLKFYIGDVRDKSSLEFAMQDIDYVFHAAALKQVPSCEFYPMEAVKTNIIGTENVISSAVATGVEKVVCLSTDKAVYPINAMGMSKAMMEKVITAQARKSGKTTICITRYGNVMASRGSVIPLFVNQLLTNKPITITDPAMTRFIMSLDEAVDLVLYAFKNGKSGDIFVQKAPGATIEVLVDSLCEIFEKNNHPHNFIGTRHGEKLFEVLLSREELLKASDLGQYYRVPVDDRDLNYEYYFESGNKKISKIEEYNSHNTYRLDKEELKRKLLDIDFIKSKLGINGGKI